MNDMPTWAKNRLAYNKDYSKKFTKKCIFSLNKNTEPELIEIYEALPNKSQWFKDCLRRYAAEHPEDE